MTDKEEREKRDRERKTTLPDETKREIVEFILSQVANGFVDHEINRQVREKFGVTRNTATNYTKRVREQLAKNLHAVKNDEDLNLSIAQIRLETLYRKAVEQGKLDIAERTLRQLHELQGLKSGGQGVSVTFNSGGPGIGHTNVSNVPSNVLEAEYRKATQQRIESQPDTPAIIPVSIAKKILKEQEK